jgi:hypothetical protein
MRAPMRVPPAASLLQALSALADAARPAPAPRFADRLAALDAPRSGGAAPAARTGDESAPRAHAPPAAGRPAPKLVSSETNSPPSPASPPSASTAPPPAGAAPGGAPRPRGSTLDLVV